MKYLYVIFIGIIFQNCLTNKSNSEISFIQKYSNEDFSDFHNSSFVIRGLDEQGNKIIFKYDTTSCGFLRMILEKDSLRLLDIKPISQRGQCVIDTSYYNYKLAKKFLEYDINFLEVDDNNNVYIKVNFGEGKPNIVRFSDKKFIQDIYLKNWVRIQDNWFVNKEKQNIKK